MAQKPEKVLVLGLDSVIAWRVYKFAQDNDLPNLKRLMDEGVFSRNALVPLPTITPPNWTTLATGTWAGTHGITEFDGHIVGDPLDVVHQNMDFREIEAETIWQAAERAGKKSIVFCWPTTWPYEPKDGYRISGFGNNINDWRINVPRAVFTQYNLTHDLLIATGGYPFAAEVNWKKAEGWDGVEHSAKAKEAEVTLVVRRSQFEMAPITWQLLVDDTQGKGYDTVTVAKSKKKGDVYARLKVGEWTPNIHDSFETNDGPKAAVFRMKMVELSPDAENVRIFIPGLCGLHGWGAPASIEDEIKSEDGMPMGRAGWESWQMEWIDDQTLVEVADFTHNWFADASEYLIKNKAWDLYFMHIHTIDWLYHTMSNELDPMTTTSPELHKRCLAMELAVYQGIDRAVGRIIEAAGGPEKNLIAVVSDHGAKASGDDFHANPVLEKAGLLTYFPAESGKPRQIDWSKTKAFGMRHVHVYVNLKGRDPQGIVEPGEEYEQVVQQVIDALYTYVDPKTGRRPVPLALKLEDARIIGHYSDHSGDVVYALDPHFGKEHGDFLPTARWGIGDMRALFIMAGPGVKKGVELGKRSIHCVDLVPTLCHLADLPLPKDTEGSVIYQALEDPDAKLKEMESLRRNVERLKRMVERPPMC
ncbi:MAG: alkaline phosphatase family protein [Dehalococcoidales bacterium]|nr:alkaline phosphatase family protein [Dehalococcoidales bacterium]